MTRYPAPDPAASALPPVARRRVAPAAVLAGSGNTGGPGSPNPPQGGPGGTTRPAAPIRSPQPDAPSPSLRDLTCASAAGGGPAIVAENGAASSSPPLKP